MTEINLSILFQETFGYKTDAFKPEFQKVPSRKEAGKIAGTPLYAKGFKGREYYLPVWFNYNESTGLGTDDGSSLTLSKTYQLPCPVISMGSRVTMVETALTKRSASVKQFINLSNGYDINIRGFLIGADGGMPEDDLAILRSLLGRPINMVNAFTDIFLIHPDRSGSDQVIMTNLNFPDVRGSKHMIAYDMRLISDEPFDLEDIS